MDITELPKKVASDSLIGGITSGFVSSILPEWIDEITLIFPGLDILDIPESTTTSFLAGAIPLATVRVVHECAKYVLYESDLAKWFNQSDQQKLLRSILHGVIDLTALIASAILTGSLLGLEIPTAIALAMTSFTIHKIFFFSDHSALEERISTLENRPQQAQQAPVNLSDFTNLIEQRPTLETVQTEISDATEQCLIEEDLDDCVKVEAFEKKMKWVTDTFSTLTNRLSQIASSPKPSPAQPVASTKGVDKKLEKVSEQLKTLQTRIAAIIASKGSSRNKRDAKTILNELHSKKFIALYTQMGQLCQAQIEALNTKKSQALPPIQAFFQKPPTLAKNEVALKFEKLLSQLKVKLLSIATTLAPKKDFTSTTLTSLLAQLKKITGKPTKIASLNNALTTANSLHATLRTKTITTTSSSDTPKERRRSRKGSSSGRRSSRKGSRRSSRRGSRNGKSSSEQRVPPLDLKGADGSGSSSPPSPSGEG